jgi:hypothetical protein
MLYYFYQILTAFNKLTIISDVVLLLPNTDSLQQADDYIRCCTTSTKYWQPSTTWRLCQRLYYFYLILTAFNNLTIMSEVVLRLCQRLCYDYVRGCTTIMSEVVLRLCQRLYYDYIRCCTTSTKYWQPSTTWRLCQRLYYFYLILTAFNNLTIMSEVVLRLCQRLYYDYVRDCTTIMSDVAHDNYKRIKLSTDFID